MNSKFGKRLLAWTGVSAVYLLPLIAIPGTAAIFLKVGDIKGDSTDKAHPEWIGAQSTQYGVSRPVGNPGAPAFSHLTLSKVTDRATPPLFLAAVTPGANPVDVEFTTSTASGFQRFYRLKLYDAIVTAFSQSSGGDRPAESVSFDYTKLEMTYTEISAKGTIGPETTAWYDLATGESYLGPAGTPNTAPTISAIANTNTAEDVGITIPFTIGDAESSAANLFLSASCTNVALLPVGNISFGGSGANRTVTLVPGGNQSGTSTVTVTVSDGSLSASTTFTLTVSTVNDAPEISPIAPQITAVNTAIGVGFMLSDPDTSLGSIQLTATSTNTALVPNSNLFFDGSGNARTLTITPAPGFLGQTLISIRAFDGSLTTTNSFLLTVSDTVLTNQPPVFVVKNASVIPAIAGRATSITRLQLADPDAGTNPVSLALQVVNGTMIIGSSPGVAITSNGTANVFLSGSIPDLNLVLIASNGVTYVANSGIAGTDLLTATVNDNGNTGAGGPLAAYTTLGLRIYASQYDQWLHEQFTQAELDNAALENALWGFHADGDSDRLENIAEYALGTNPRGTNHPRPAAQFTNQSGTNFLSLQFNKRIDPDLTLAVEVADDVTGPWSSDGTQVQTFAPIDLGNGFEQVRFSDRVGSIAKPQRFMRMRWTLNQPFAGAATSGSVQR